MPGAKPVAAFITPVIPSRTELGLAMRAASQLAGLMRVFDVTVLVVPVIPSPGSLEQFSAAFPKASLQVLDIGGHEDPYFRLIASLGDPAERLAHFRRYGKPSLAAAVTEPVALKVAGSPQRMGAQWVHIFRSYLLAALDAVPESLPRSIDLDEDDVSSCLSIADVMERHGDGHGASWSRVEAQGFSRLIGQKLTGFRAVTLANAGDMPSFAGRHPGLPLRVVGNCVRLPPLPAHQPERHRRQGLLFVGALGYWPNVDGLAWFITEVLPRLPGVRLRVVGRDPPQRLRALAAPGRVAFLGYVRNLGDVYRDACVAIAPMRSGGGTRLKIIEAASFAVPVVATPEAASGLWNTARPWGRVARDSPRFAAACRFLLANPRMARALGEQGRRTVASRFSTTRMDAAWAQLFQSLHEGDRT